MKQTNTLKEKIKQIFVLIIPILITQISLFSMVFFNNIMSGRYNSSDLAGVAIGASIWNPIFTGLSGILLAISPIVAHHFGEKKEKEISSTVSNGIFLAILIGLLVILIGACLLQPLLNSMHLSNKVKGTAQDYLIGLSYGIIPLFIFNVLRSYIYALGKTRVVMIMMIFSLPINFFFNYTFIFGKWGFPELGGAGAGYATSITYWFIAALTVMIIKLQSPFNLYHVFPAWNVLSISKCKDILKIGVPMGLSTFFETSMFAVVTILISKFSITTIAAYQSALNIVSFLYMIPVSISLAITVLVGYEVGASRYKDARIYSWLGIFLSIMIAMITGILVVLFRYQVAELYSNETAVINLTAQFLFFALFFQISDAIQATAQAALRGYKDVNLSFIMTLIAYWLICLPVGYLLANFTSLEARGFWIGLTIGLLAAGICLSLRLVYIQRKNVVYVQMKAG